MVGVTLIALVPAAAVLSAVSPAVAHLQLHDLEVSGTVVGSLSAWATAGALLGTFGTGFVLIPLMPVSSAVLVIGTVLVLVGIVLGASSRAVLGGRPGGGRARGGRPRGALVEPRVALHHRDQVPLHPPRLPTSTATAPTT